jgi:hypothetical protein
VLGQPVAVVGLDGVAAPGAFQVLRSHR